MVGNLSALLVTSAPRSVSAMVEWVNEFKGQLVNWKTKSTMGQEYGNGLMCSFLRISFYFKYFEHSLVALSYDGWFFSQCLYRASFLFLRYQRNGFHWQLWPHEAFAWLSADSASQWAWNVKWPSWQRNSIRFPLSLPHTALTISGKKKMLLYILFVSIIFAKKRDCLGIFEFVMLEVTKHNVQWNPIFIVFIYIYICLYIYSYISLMFIYFCILHLHILHVSTYTKLPSWLRW